MAEYFPPGTHHSCYLNIEANLILSKISVWSSEYRRNRKVPHAGAVGTIRSGAHSQA